MSLGLAKAAAKSEGPLPGAITKAFPARYKSPPFVPLIESEDVEQGAEQPDAGGNGEGKPCAGTGKPVASKAGVPDLSAARIAQRNTPKLADHLPRGGWINLPHCGLEPFRIYSKLRSLLLRHTDFED